MEWLRKLFSRLMSYFDIDPIHHQTVTMHYKCRNALYPRSTIMRQHVPDNKISWDIEFPEYAPISYTSESVHGKPWADVDFEREGDVKSVPWNQIDKNINVDRRSFMGQYKFSKDGFPLNPVGRTGIRGRGVLGRWGPNHAGDPIVTRWERDSKTNEKIINKLTNKPQLQFVSIQRKDSKEWAIPGGMVDPGEKITETLKREFAEEAMSSLEKSQEEKMICEAKLNDAFHHGNEIYKGYVDDPRNTDNAWMETVAYNFHDEKGDIFNIDFKAGDDAIGVRWMGINKDIKLYASHKDFIQKVVELRKAHW